MAPAKKAPSFKDPSKCFHPAIVTFGGKTVCTLCHMVLIDHGELTKWLTPEPVPVKTTSPVPPLKEPIKVSGTPKGRLFRENE